MTILEVPTKARAGMWPMFLLIAGLLAAGVGGWVWYARYDTYHLATVEKGVLYRDGNRTRREFANMLRRSKPRTVVSLVDDAEMGREPFSHEGDDCRSAGAEFVRVPVKLGGWPTTADVTRFLSVATDKARQPVLVHCAQGVRRTGMMVAAYQESALAYDKQRAKEAILRFGHSDRSIGDVKRFIDIYDPRARGVTAELPQSKEGSTGGGGAERAEESSAD